MKLSILTIFCLLLAAYGSNVNFFQQSRQQLKEEGSPYFLFVRGLMNGMGANESLQVDTYEKCLQNDQTSLIEQLKKGILLLKNREEKIMNQGWSLIGKSSLQIFDMSDECANEQEHHIRLFIKALLRKLEINPMRGLTSKNDVIMFGINITKELNMLIESVNSNDAQLMGQRLGEIVRLEYSAEYIFLNMLAQRDVIVGEFLMGFMQGFAHSLNIRLEDDFFVQCYVQNVMIMHHLERGAMLVRMEDLENGLNEYHKAMLIIPEQLMYCYGLLEVEPKLLSVVMQVMQEMNQPTQFLFWFGNDYLLDVKLIHDSLTKAGDLWMSYEFREAGHEIGIIMEKLYANPRI